MKKLPLFCLLIVLAGCGEVSVDGDFPSTQEPDQTGQNPGQTGANPSTCEGEACEGTSVADGCSDFEMVCNDSGQLQYTCKTDESIHSGDLCECDEGQTVCKVRTEVQYECDSKLYTLECISSEGNADSLLAITCNHDGNSINDVQICEHGCGLNQQGIASCYHCMSNSDCEHEQQCIEHNCVDNSSTTIEPVKPPEPCSTEDDFEYFCDTEESGLLMMQCKSNPEMRKDALVKCPCVMKDSEPVCVQCNGIIGCDGDLKCEQNRCINPEVSCKTNMDCGEYNVCDNGQCVSAPCGTIENDFSTYHICRSEDIKKYKDNKDNAIWNGLHKLEFHGVIECSNSDCHGINLPDREMSILGQNNATIIAASGYSFTKPLFIALKNKSVQNLTLQYNVQLDKANGDGIDDSTGTRGMLANHIYKSVINNISLVNSSLKYDGEKIVNVGALAGSAKGEPNAIAEFNNITITNVTMTLNARSKEVCSDSKYHRSIGGIIGNARQTEINLPKIQVLTISSGLAAHVGGIVGTAQNVSVSGSLESLAEPIEYDVSNLKIENAERDAAGIFGEVSDSFSINNLSIQSDLIESKLPCAGGVVGYVTGGSNTDKDVNMLYVNNKNIISGRYAGGLIGLKEQNSKMSVHNVLLNNGTIKSSQLDDSFCAGNDKDGQHDGLFAGGLIGKILDVSNEINFLNIKNVFNTVEATNYSAGFIGALSGVNNVKIDDVVNSGLSVKSLVTNSASGGFISSIDDSVLEITNVVNEVNNINGSESGGLIGRFNTSKLINPTIIKSTVSTVSLSSDSVTAGFIGSINIFKDGFIGSNKMQISDVLTRSVINTSSDDSVAGFISTIDNFKHETQDNFFISIKNILVDSNIYIDKSTSHWSESNIFRLIKNSKISLTHCPVNQYSSQSGLLSKFVSNSFYTTYGYFNDGSIADEVNDINCHWYEKPTTCMNYKSFKFPLMTCWFSDYCSGSQCPVSPYYIYSCTADNPAQCSLDCSESSSDCTELLAEPNNILGVKQSLDSTWKTESFDEKHSWNDCSTDVIKSKLTMNYDRLLCPILTGAKYTCMKSGGCAE